MTIIYLVDYWVPFPSSEYGGIVAVLAESDEECFDILSNTEEYDDRFVDRIVEKVKSARKFPLAFDFEHGIVESFTT